MSYWDYLKKILPKIYVDTIKKELDAGNLDGALRMLYLLGKRHADSEYFDDSDNILIILKIFLKNLHSVFSLRGRLNKAIVKKLIENESELFGKDRFLEIAKKGKLIFDNLTYCMELATVFVVQFIGFLQCLAKKKTIDKEIYQEIVINLREVHKVCRAIVEGTEHIRIAFYNNANNIIFFDKKKEELSKTYNKLSNEIERVTQIILKMAA